MITAQIGDPILSSDKTRIVAYFAQTISLPSDSFHWSWHTITPANWKVKYDEIGYGNEKRKVPSNRGSIYIDYNSTPLRIWRVGSLLGDTKDAFIGPYFDEVKQTKDQEIYDALGTVIEALGNHAGMYSKEYLLEFRNYYDRRRKNTR